ncbi:hypothetical protein [Pseudomonas sp. CFBP 13719]|uniref:hypothetical protein n=1 Tax=Pseudomonas sp. CFBP 13719 TaxID=2775303 RepID=UPI00178683EE|nr:hypothetical protein [Pseudomonas sp. CFBP 13719]MBD8614883.1 hypothetical protein [Pseudomonas putida]MBD8681433.1 hypothetical protein [Pseudomonas sp. CFBP 13719]
MGKLYFHCGDHAGAPEGAEILGHLTLTGAEMSAIGKALQAPTGNEAISVFSNSNDVFNGARLAIRNGSLDPKNFTFVYHYAGLSREISVGNDGDLLDMAPGFFDQSEIDLLELF